MQGGGAADARDFATNQLEDGEASLFMEDDGQGVRFSIIPNSGPDNNVNGNKEDLNWNDLIDDYGTIRPSDTQRDKNEEIKAGNTEIV